jgi:hypothetical protein
MGLDKSQIDMRQVTEGHFEKFQTGSLLVPSFFWVRVTHESHTGQNGMDHGHGFSRDRLNCSNIFNTLVGTPAWTQIIFN